MSVRKNRIERRKGLLLGGLGNWLCVPRMRVDEVEAGVGGKKCTEWETRAETREGGLRTPRKFLGFSLHCAFTRQAHRVVVAVGRDAFVTNSTRSSFVSGTQVSQPLSPLTKLPVLFTLADTLYVRKQTSYSRAYSARCASCKQFRENRWTNSRILVTVSIFYGSPLHPILPNIQTKRL